MKAMQTISLVLVLILLTYNLSFADNKTPIAKQNIQRNNGEYVRERFLKLIKQPFIVKNNPMQKKILIIGDSHAQDFLNAIMENNYLTQDQIKTRYIPTRCQIFLDKNIHQNWLAEDKQLCDKSDNLELAKAQINQADVIIFAAFWRKWAAQALAKTISNLQLKPEQTIFVIGRRSFRKIDKSKTVNLSNIELKQLQNTVDENQIEINTLMQNTLDKNIFVNVHKLICGTDSTTCPAYTDNYKLISFDGGHLSKEGARYFGRIIFQQSQLKSLL